MRRELLCRTCADEAMKQMGNYPGEHHKWRSGTVQERMFICCDRCVADLPSGTWVMALSIWTDRGGIPYYEWEHDYLDF